MKFVFTISVMVLLFSACNSQSIKEKKAPDAVPVPIKATISAKGSLKNINIINQSADTLWYYVSLQIWEDNHWIDILSDINPKAPDRTEYPVKLPPGKDTTRTCNLQVALPALLKTDTAKFNFKVCYGKEVDSIQSFIETEAFNLNK